MELKPCPFCGCELVGKDEIWRHKVTNITAKYTVYSHPQKECILDFSRYHFYNNPHDIERWNRRVKEDSDGT